MAKSPCSPWWFVAALQEPDDGSRYERLRGSSGPSVHLQRAEKMQSSNATAKVECYDWCKVPFYSINLTDYLDRSEVIHRFVPLNYCTCERGHTNLVQRGIVFSEGLGNSPSGAAAKLLENPFSPGVLFSVFAARGEAQERLDLDASAGN